MSRGRREVPVPRMDAGHAKPLAWGISLPFDSLCPPENRVGQALVASRKYHKYIVCMNELRFEWDRRKERANLKKHGVSFDEARTAFHDESATVFFDPDHSDGEDRFILLGLSHRLRVVVVCHCFRESETVVRIISARKANKNEDREYWRRRT